MNTLLETRWHKKPDDEYYTRYKDIQAELSKHNLENKLILANCDTKQSQFIQYFKDNNLNFLRSKQFETHKSIEKLKACDIVITNPPFSKLNKLLQLINHYKKDFLILGPPSLITKKVAYVMALDQRLFSSRNSVRHFDTPTGTKTITTHWFASWNIAPDNPPLKLTVPYSPDSLHREYDFFPNIINVDKTKNIPYDYDGIMGVPVSYLQKHCPSQFKLVHVEGWRKSPTDTEVDGKPRFQRLLIQRQKK